MSTLHSTLGFIGAGNMAHSIISGLINKGTAPQLITASNPRSNKLTHLMQEYGIQTTTDNNENVEKSQLIILAVKPQVLPSVLEEIKKTVNPTTHLVISIASGITIADLAQKLPSNTPIIRAMPNTPTQIGEGLTCCVANHRVSEEQKALATTVFDGVGTTLWVQDDDAIDKAAAIAGCGPAYFFYMMESLLTVAKEWGFSDPMAKTLVAQTALGAAQLYTQGSKTPASLQQAVTSPEGMTAAAIELLDKNTMKETIASAVKAAYDRAIALSKEVG